MIVMQDHTMPAPSAVVRRLHQALATGDVAGVLACFAPDGVFDCVGGPPHLPWCGLYHGHAGLREYLRRHAGAAETLAFEATEVTLLGGDRVLAAGAVRLRFHATGLEAASRWVHLYGIAGGRIVSGTEWGDTAAQLVAYRGY